MATDRGMVTDQNAGDESPKGTFEGKIRKEAMLRLRLEDLVDLNQRYKTIFEGLKMNTAHNSAVIQPLSFMLRRIFYAALIVFMPHEPQVAMITLLSASVLMLAFAVHEKPWKDTEMQNLAVVNEVFFYVLLVLVLTCSCSTSRHSLESSILGWTIIAVVTLSIFVNLSVILANAWNHSKLLHTRYKNKQAHVAKKSKIASLSVELANLDHKNLPAIDGADKAIPEVIEEVSSNNEESYGFAGLPQPSSEGSES